MRVLLAVILLAIFTPLSGCLEVEEDPCPDSNCFPLTSDALNDILSDSNSFNVIAYSQMFDRLRVETTASSTVQGQFGEVYWSVAKDDSKQLRSVSTRVTLGTYSMNNEVIEGGEITNIRVGNVWFEGRDEAPNYSDPFEEFAQLSTMDPGGDWPPFGFDTTQISGLDWRITGDEPSLQQVASATNSSHTIVLELKGSPPIITSIETYAGDEDQFVLTVSTGEDVVLELMEDIERAPLGFSPDNAFLVEGEITQWAGSVQSGFATEANPSELVIHGIIGSDDNYSSVSSMNLDFGTYNETLGDGTWWDFIWSDQDSDGLVSSGDIYAVRTNATGELSIAVYDLWAGAWTGGPLAAQE
ncbi:MAG: hypothetical protein CMB53_02320 [Euryarchaeota archaeon]|nr:hypothetical protein [Euryarchaeota archaeon]